LRIVMAASALALAGTVVLAQPASGANAVALPASNPTDLAERLQPCTTCHGKAGRATADGFYPRIAGKPAGYLYRQLVDFRDGRRHNATMTWMVSRMSDDYLREVAAYFASVDLPYPPPEQVQPSATVLERGRRLVAEGDPARQVPACTRCHGEQLAGVEPWIPGLLGLPHGYIAGELGAWRSGSRRADAPDCMSQVAARLDLQDIDAVSSWLATQAPPPGYRPKAGPAADLPLRCGSVAP
jgi:cytochrome c553